MMVDGVNDKVEAVSEPSVMLAAREACFEGTFQ